MVAPLQGDNPCSLMIPRVEHAERIDVLVLGEGMDYDMGLQHPFQGAESEDELEIFAMTSLAPWIQGILGKIRCWRQSDAIKYH